MTLLSQQKAFIRQAAVGTVCEVLFIMTLMRRFNRTFVTLSNYLITNAAG